MAHLKTIRLVSLNVTMHPHSPELYADLFGRAYDLKSAVKLRGSDYGMIGSTRYDPKSQTITGELYKFLNIDLTKPWFNSEKLKEAEDADLRELNIPENLKPNLERFSYIFYLEGHHIFVETYRDGNTLGPQQIKKLFSTLFCSPTITAKLGMIDVTIEPNHETLEQILSIPTLNKLIIRVSRPNPDDLGEDISDEVYDRMEHENVSYEERVLTSVKGKSIEPSVPTKQYAKVAASNGFVKGHGRGKDNRVIDISTIQHPFIAETTYDETIQLSSSAFQNEAERMWNSIKARMRRRRVERETVH